MRLPRLKPEYADTFHHCYNRVAGEPGYFPFGNIELNPVRAGIAESPCDYPWSSAGGNVGLAPDTVLDPSRPFPGPIGDWRAWLSLGLEEETAARLRANTLSGRPTGDEGFRRRIAWSCQVRTRRSAPVEASSRLSGLKRSPWNVPQ
jgi:hypothetical protein